MDSENPSKLGAHHGQHGAQQALSAGGERMVSLLVGPERTKFLCNASLLSHYSPFFASLLSDRWTAAAGSSSGCSGDGEKGVALVASAKKGAGDLVDSWKLKSVDAKDFSRVMLLLAHKHLEIRFDSREIQLDFASTYAIMSSWVEQVQLKAVQPDLRAARLCLYTKVRFRETLRADIDVGRFQKEEAAARNMNLVLVSHGLTLRVFLMRCRGRAAGTLWQVELLAL
ncbi:unnamed protein product [Closterium sp. NIES-64]|nr:unnamed protein product [Closterium sp. NIES-64]